MQQLVETCQWMDADKHSWVNEPSRAGPQSRSEEVWDASRH
jgi:hypothetical protein